MLYFFSPTRPLDQILNFFSNIFVRLSTYHLCAKGDSWSDPYSLSSIRFIRDATRNFNHTVKDNVFCDGVKPTGGVCTALHNLD